MHRRALFALPLALLLPVPSATTRTIRRMSDGQLYAEYRTVSRAERVIAFTWSPIDAHGRATTTGDIIPVHELRAALA